MDTQETKKLNIALVADHYDLERMMGYAKSKEQLGKYHRQPSLRTVEDLIAGKKAGEEKIDVLVVGVMHGVEKTALEKVIKHAKTAQVTVLAVDSRAANILHIKNKCYDTSPPVAGKETDLERNFEDRIWDRIYKLATSPHVSKKVESGVPR